MPGKKFSLVEAVLAVICIILVVEAAAPAAALGNAQYFWWIFMIITFLLPYGLISAELGSAYEDDGGIYDWVKRAFGRKWASRVAWYYWINYPLWMVSLAVLVPMLISTLLGRELPAAAVLGIELFFIWTVVYLSFKKIGDSKWILNGTAAIKIFLALLIGVLGVYAAFTKGLATEFTLRSLLPSFDASSLSLVIVIVFNFMGFEVMASFTSDMKNPQKELPRAIIVSGAAIAAIYLFTAFGINVAIPREQIAATGYVDSIIMLTGSPTGFIVIGSGILFILTLFGNILSWAFGVNYVTSYAARNNDMPKVFAKVHPKTGMPEGAAVMNGVTATVLVLITTFLSAGDLFWKVFALNIATHLIAYIPLFLAFLKLRKIDPDTPRPFRVGGGKITLWLVTFVPMAILLITLVFCAVPLEFTEKELDTKVPILAGLASAAVMGEIIVYFSAKRGALPIQK